MAGGPLPASKEMRALVRRFKPGYSLQPSGRTRFTVVGPDGEPVLLPDGSGRPLRLPSTPSTSGGEHEERLQEAGVLRSGTARSRALRARAARNGDTAVESDDPAWRIQAQERAHAAKQVDERLRTAIVNRIGGWETRGMKADVLGVANVLAERDGREPLGENTGFMALDRVIHGQGVLPDTLAAFAAIPDELDRWSDPIARWFQLVRQARGLPMPMPDERRWAPGEWPFEVKLLRLDQLFADHRYQRPLDEGWVRKKAPVFDERLVGVIDVSDRGDGTFAMLDGQQRVGVLSLVRKTTCFCAIYTGMDVKAEARFFDFKNKDRKSVTPFYRYRARLVGEDETALAINALVEAQGFVVRQKPNDEDAIGAVGALEFAYLLSSETRGECLSPTLDLIGSVWRGRPLSTDAEIIRGIARFFQTFQDPEIDFGQLRYALREAGPIDVAGLARDRERAYRSRGRGSGKGVMEAIVTVYNRGLPKSHQLVA